MLIYGGCRDLRCSGFSTHRGSSHGLLASHHQFSQGDMVAISQKRSLDDEDSTVIEGVVIDQARRFLLSANKDF
ncbi:hypothetical protein CY35_07G026300 [Sphagnum magellanicum]|uniref:Uncharacterized protein n=1 Tax=Sphagnum magellanicum TaxID=128215 RepID=A0ACB8HJL4_9BRYO|nr:hypothetical protein CY35_07G026300 [Sphagnum magellanicum]